MVRTLLIDGICEVDVGKGVKMIFIIKNKLRRMIKQIDMIIEFYNDYCTYKRWNYNNPRVHTQSAYESKILRQTHIIEKGLSLSEPRKGFGQEKIKDLFRMLEEYMRMGFPTDGIPFQNALVVLDSYFVTQKAMGVENEQLIEMYNRYKDFNIDSFSAGIEYCCLEKMSKERLGLYPEFFASRHSMRQFSERPIEKGDVIKAVKLAQKAPSACNRQATKVYYYSDPVVNSKLGNLIAGNTGFENEVKAYLVLTGDMSAFYDSFERNQLYIEGGMFAMALIEALHYYGIASCALQNGEYKKKNQKFKEICGNIPDNERIILFIAIGYYRDEFKYAISKRKSIESVLIEK